MSDVKIKYDPQTDILRLRFGDTPIEESDQVEPGIIVDYDAEGHIVGVELLDASELIVKTNIAQSGTVSAPGD